MVVLQTSYQVCTSRNVNTNFFCPHSAVCVCPSFCIFCFILFYYYYIDFNYSLAVVIVDVFLCIFRVAGGSPQQQRLSYACFFRRCPADILSEYAWVVIFDMFPLVTTMELNCRTCSMCSQPTAPNLVPASLPLYHWRRLWHMSPETKNFKAGWNTLPCVKQSSHAGFTSSPWFLFWSFYR